MLVLSRKPNEEIVIPQFGITITMMQISGTKARIGVTAPSEVEVYRREVWDRIEAERAAAEGPGPASKKPGNPQILVVEDNPDCRWGLESLLKVLGYRVESAGDGKEGLEMALRDHPPVLLVDLNMPGMNGVDLARKLRQQPGFEQATLVAVTGSEDMRDEAASAAAGFDALLTKPVNLDKLQEMLARVCPLAA